MKDQTAADSPAVAALKALVTESDLDLSMIDRDGRLMAVSEGSLRRSGMARDQLVGQRIQDLFGEAVAEATAVLTSAAIATTQALTPQSIPLTTGKSDWYQATLTPWRDESGEIGGAINFLRNITAEQRAQLELSRAEALLDAVVESIPSLISVSDRETGALVRINRAAEKFMGASRDDLLGRPSAGVFGSDAVKRHRAQIAKAEARGEMLIAEEEYSGCEGSRTLLVRRQVIAGRDGRRHVLSVADDITGPKRAKAELLSALAEAEAANHAKSDFLATMSHEIRTPLNGILGMAQVMARDELTLSQRERLEIVRNSGESLLRIINDVLDLAKIEAHKLEVESFDFDLGDVIDSAAAIFSALASAKGLVLEVNLDLAAGVYRGDPTRIRQIISNLLSNAVKFTQAGSVRLTARFDMRGLEIAVSDTGPGIPSEAFGRLFEKFVQAESSTTRRFGGTGLGLAICRELAQLMGGNIVAENLPGEGARFTVRLPVQRLGDARPNPAVQPPAVEDLGALRILAAEDNPVNQKVLQTILEQLGVAVTLVGDGAQAVEAYRAAPWDIVLMDVQMPVMDGVQATRGIRLFEREAGRAPTPIVALTANALEHQKSQYLASGMDALVAKPIQIDELFGAIERLTCAQNATPSVSPSPMAHLPGGAAPADGGVAGH